MKSKTKQPPVRSKTERGKRLSLHPLSFDEVVTDILKAKPERKSIKRSAARKSRNA